MIKARIDASDEPAEEKSAIKKAIGLMGTETSKESTKLLVSEGTRHWPQALELLRSFTS